MNGIEAVRIAEEVVWRLRRATDAELGDTMRFDVEIETRLHDRRTDRVVAATGTGVEMAPS